VPGGADGARLGRGKAGRGQALGARSLQVARRVEGVVGRLPRSFLLRRKALSNPSSHADRASAAGPPA
jgi:hypothetical protein